MAPRSIEEVAFEAAAEGFLVVDKKGLIYQVNQRLNDLFGYTREELLGKPLSLLLPDQIKDRHAGHFAKFWNSPHERTMGQGMDLQAKRKDGSLFDVEISLTPFERESEFYVLGIVNDISERKRRMDELVETKENLDELTSELEQRVAQRTEQLEESQRLYQLISRNFPDGVISIFNKDLQYVFVEGMELFKYGVTSEALTGTFYKDRLSPDLEELILPRMRAVLKGEDQSFEIDKDGEHYMLNAVSLLDKQGEVDQILLVEHNITKQRRAAIELAEALTKERQLNEMKSRFVSLASHEFRTPLSSILSSATLIEKYTEGVQQANRKKHVDRIRSSVHNLTSILNDFLSLDKLEHGMVQAKCSPFLLVELAKETIEEVNLTAGSGKTIQYSHEGEKEPVHSDAALIKNILINLLNNAVKYSKTEGVVKLQTEQIGNQFSITVKDQGIGIPKAEQGALFSRFFRATNVSTIQGTGLGLNIVKNYVDLLKGQIDWESTEGKGSRFTIQLPSKIKAHA